jgi:site-specific recombinase XerD
MIRYINVGIPLRWNSEQRVHGSMDLTLILLVLESRQDSCKALFVTETHPTRRMTLPTIRWSLKKLANRGKVAANVYPYRFRHTYAFQLLDNGAPLEFIQGMLGHEVFYSIPLTSSIL